MVDIEYGRQCSLLVTIFITMAIRMAYRRTDLDHLWQKKLRYDHHKINYQVSLQEDIIPLGLKIHRKPGIVAVSPDFEDKWEGILNYAERELVKLLGDESSKVILSLDRRFDDELNKANNDGTELRTKEDFIRQHSDFKKSLEERRRSKWKKFKEKRDGKGRRRRYRRDVRNRRSVSGCKDQSATSSKETEATTSRTRQVTPGDGGGKYRILAICLVGPLSFIIVTSIRNKNQY